MSELPLKRRKKTDPKSVRELNPELYHLWCNILYRCRNNTRSKKYGDRGIKVCKRWKVFENFYIDAICDLHEEHQCQTK